MFVTTSLKDHGADEEVEKMFEMGEETMKLPLEEKMKYEQGDDGMNFGSVRAHRNARTDCSSTISGIKLLAQMR